MTRVKLSHTVKSQQQWQASMGHRQKARENPRTLGRAIAMEIDLTTKSFKRASAPNTEDPVCAITPTGQQQTEPDLSEFSSQDTTLLEMREQAQLTAETSSKSKRRKGDTRLTRQGVSTREEFFFKDRVD